jgi:hypothetical protein
MTAHSTATVEFWLTTGAPASGTMSGAPTQGKPTGIGGTLTNGADGDIVVCSGTNWSSVDRIQIASNIQGSAFDLLGCDSTRESAGTAVAGKFDHYDATKMTKLCPSGFTDSVTTPGTVSTATYCDPTQTIPSPVADAGTAELTGYVDICDDDYIALYEAYEMQDQRYLKIDLGDAGGYLIMPVTAVSMQWDLPIDGAVGYTISFVKGSATKHAFGPCI